MLACPICHAPLDAVAQGCPHPWPTVDGLPDLYHPAPEAGEREPVSAQVRAFYEESPFPDYRESDDIAEIVRRGRANAFTRALDEEIPRGATVLELGCGTGQMSNFLGASGRRVLGVDLSLASLRRAEGFRQRSGLASVRFARANLFAPPVAPGTVDVVVANGVLHHTGHCRAAFAAAGRCVRPGGYLVVGLYNRWGRLLLPLLRREHAGEQTTRGQAWYRDQHEHPEESRHTVGEVLGWLGQNEFDYVGCSPHVPPWLPAGGIFTPRPVPSALEAWIAQTSWLARARDGGLWITVGRRR